MLAATRRKALGLLSALAVAACATTPVAPPAPQIGLYELRIYTPAEGKKDALDARFRDHTIGLFRKHGMTPIAFWHVNTSASQPADNRLFYLMGYQDRAARDAAWTAFAADPEWRSVYQASQANGSLTAQGGIASTFLTPTDYSPALDLASSATPRLFELRTYTANPGKLEDIHARFRNHTTKIFARLGMTNFLYWRPVDGQAGMESKMVYLMAYPNAAARTQAWRDFIADAEWKTVAAESEKNGPLLASPGGVVSVQLVPTDYSPVK
jgi:hypothetical protein